MVTLYNTLSFQFQVSVFTHFFAIFKTSQLKQIKAFPALLFTFPALKAWVLRIKTRKHRLGTLCGELKQTPALDHILDWNWGSWVSRCQGLHERRTHWLGPHWRELEFPLGCHWGPCRPSVRADLQAGRQWAAQAVPLLGCVEHQLWVPGEHLLWGWVQSQLSYRPEKFLGLWEADLRCKPFPGCCMNFCFLLSHGQTHERKQHIFSPLVILSTEQINLLFETGSH